MIPREIEGWTGWLSVSQKENRVRMSLVRGTPRTRHGKRSLAMKASRLSRARPSVLSEHFTESPGIVLRSFET